MSRFTTLTDRAATRAAADANLAALRVKAAEAAAAIGPRVTQARGLAEPYVATTRVRVEPLVTSARELAEPYVTTTRERLTPLAEQAIASGRDIAQNKIKPGYEYAVETTRETVAPAVAAALANAATTTAPARTEAKLRGSAALAALRGEDQPESHREAQGGLFSRVRDAFNGR